MGPRYAGYFGQTLSYLKRAITPLPQEFVFEVVEHEFLLLVPSHPSTSYIPFDALPAVSWI